MIELNFPNAVHREEDFYGRHPELQRIDDVLTSGIQRPLVVYGERRIGKTSLMNVVAGRLRARHQPKVVPLFPATVGIFTYDDLAREILQSLCELRGTTLVERGLVDNDRRFCLTSVGQFFEKAQELLGESSATLYLLCIDEFDALLRDCLEFHDAGEARKVLDLSKEITRRANLPMSLFLTLTRMPDLVRDSFNAIVTDQAERIDLQLLKSHETCNLLDGILGDDVMINQTERLELDRLAGGHPYVLKLLLSNLLALTRPEKYPLTVGPDLLAEAVERAARDPRAEHALGNLMRVHMNQHERDLVTLMASLDDRIDARQLDRAGKEWRTAVHSLRQRGYLGQETSSAPLVFRSAFWGHWLRQQPDFEEKLHHLAEVRDRLMVEIEIDPARGRVYLRGEEVQFSAGDYEALSYLCQHAGELVSRDQLVQHLWPTAEGDVNEAAIDAIAYRLRRRLGDSARQPRYLETRPGQGFILHRAAYAGSSLAAKKESDDD